MSWPLWAHPGALCLHRRCLLIQKKKKEKKKMQAGKQKQVVTATSQVTSLTWPRCEDDFECSGVVSTCRLVLLPEARRSAAVRRVPLLSNTLLAICTGPGVTYSRQYWRHQAPEESTGRLQTPCAFKPLQSDPLCFHIVRSDPFHCVGTQERGAVAGLGAVDVLKGVPIPGLDARLQQAPPTSCSGSAGQCR